MIKDPYDASTGGARIMRGEMKPSELMKLPLQARQLILELQARVEELEESLHAEEMVVDRLEVLVQQARQRIEELEDTLNGLDASLKVCYEERETYRQRIEELEEVAETSHRIYAQAMEQVEAERDTARRRLRDVIGQAVRFHKIALDKFVSEPFDTELINEWFQWTMGDAGLKRCERCGGDGTIMVPWDPGHVKCDNPRCISGWVEANDE